MEGKLRSQIKGFLDFFINLGLTNADIILILEGMIDALKEQKK